MITDREALPVDLRTTRLICSRDSSVVVAISDMRRATVADRIWRYGLGSR